LLVLQKEKSETILARRCCVPIRRWNEAQVCMLGFQCRSLLKETRF
jgi:hypothetical protein